MPAMRESRQALIRLITPTKMWSACAALPGGRGGRGASMADTRSFPIGILDHFGACTPLLITYYLYIGRVLNDDEALRRAQVASSDT